MILIPEKADCLLEPGSELESVEMSPQLRSWKERVPDPMALRVSAPKK